MPDASSRAEGGRSRARLAACRCGRVDPLVDPHRIAAARRLILGGLRAGRLRPALRPGRPAGGRRPREGHALHRRGPRRRRVRAAAGRRGRARAAHRRAVGHRRRAGGAPRPAAAARDARVADLPGGHLRSGARLPRRAAGRRLRARGRRARGLRPGAPQPGPTTTRSCSTSSPPRSSPSWSWRPPAPPSATSPGRLDVALEASSVGIWEVDLRPARWTGTSAARRSSGYDGRGHPPMDGLITEHVHPDDRAVAGRPCRPPSRPAPSTRSSCAVVRPRRRVRWTVSRGRVLVDADGEPVRILGHRPRRHRRARSRRRRRLAAIQRARRDRRGGRRGRRAPPASRSSPTSPCAGPRCSVPTPAASPSFDPVGPAGCCAVPGPPADRRRRGRDAGAGHRSRRGDRARRLPAHPVHRPHR